MKKAITLSLLTIVMIGAAGLFLTSPAQAGIGEAPGWSGIVPCGRNIGTAAEQAPCTLCHLVIGIQRIVQYGLYLVIALAFVAIFFSGTMYIVSVGDESAMSNAKDFLRASLIGFAVVAGAWLIVNTTLWVLGKKGDLGIGVTSWSNFTCSTASSALTGSGQNTSNASGVPTTNTSAGCCVRPEARCSHVSNESQCNNGTFQSRQCSDISDCR